MQGAYTCGAMGSRTILSLPKAMGSHYVVPLVVGPFSVCRKPWGRSYVSKGQPRKERIWEEGKPIRGKTLRCVG